MLKICDKSVKNVVMENIVLKICLIFCLIKYSPVCLLISLSDSKMVGGVIRSWEECGIKRLVALADKVYVKQLQKKQRIGN